jgi:hypothetical protein
MSNVQRLYLGHFWDVAAQNLAVVGRIWVVCRHLLVGVQVCYAGLADMPGEQVGEIPENLFKFMPEDLVE